MNPNAPLPVSPSSGEVGARMQSALFWLVGLLGIAAILGRWIEWQAQSILYTGLELYLGWCAFIGFIRILYIRWTLAGNREPSPGMFALIGQWVLLFLGIFVLARISYPGLLLNHTLDQIPVERLRLAAVILLGCAAVLYFFTNYARLVQGKSGADAITSVLQLSQIASLACAAASGLTFLFLSTQHDFSRETGAGLVGLTVLLALEALIRFAARFYLPASQRGLPAPAGESLILDLISGSSRSMGRLVGEMETLLGGRLSEIWIVRFLREMAETVVLAGILLAWLSTSLTSVPLESSGVRIAFGQYDTQPLPPGLHVSWPWPLGQIDLVETERVREITLGFDQDLAGPVLWTERHYVGEQNLLVGNGESLLTIDVPIQYRVADAIAFSKATPDAPAALKSLAERKLIQVAQSRESFQIMTVDREQMATELKQGLQAEADRLGLGLEITFVGLKNVHPPVDVAPAYEKVVSAQETEEATIDIARAYEARVMPEAHAAAQRLLAEADAAATQRIDQATARRPASPRWSAPSGKIRRCSAPVFATTRSTPACPRRPSSSSASRARRVPAPTSTFASEAMPESPRCPCPCSRPPVIRSEPKEMPER